MDAVEFKKEKDAEATIEFEKIRMDVMLFGSACVAYTEFGVFHVPHNEWPKDGGTFLTLRVSDDPRI